MSKPDLTAAPYQLDKEAIAWVRGTIDAMSVDEKVGQLFINLNNRFDDDFVNHIVDDYHPGGMRYNHTDSASVQAHIRHAQSRSIVPLLVASNIEATSRPAATVHAPTAPWWPHRYRPPRRPTLKPPVSWA
jgi:hypothetical protein